jgi:hypothetical protein
MTSGNSRPDPSCPVSLECQLSVAIASSDTAVCEKFCIDFTDQSLNNPIAWEWLFPGGIPSTSTDQNPNNICYQNPGVYDVTLITTSINGNDTLTLPGFVTVYPTPSFPVITQNGTTLTSSVATSYQWQFNGVDIAGATSQSYAATASGFYTVIITDENGCTNSTTLYVEITGIEDFFDGIEFDMQPNPSYGTFQVSGSGLTGELSFEVVNTLGQQLFFEEEAVNGLFRKEIDLSLIAPGVYYVRLTMKKDAPESQHGTLVKKLVMLK